MDESAICFWTSRTVIYAKHVLFLGNIIKKFKSEKEKLITTRDLVLKKIKAINETEKLNDAVSEWLNEAEKLMEEKEKMKIELQITEQTVSNSCFLKEFYFGKKYQLYNEMQTKMKALNTKCEFDSFSIPIPGIEYFSCENFLCFKPTKEASDQLLEALQDDSNYIIGLHGMRGSGKTKLAKAVVEKAKFLRIFSTVIFVTVSQTPNINMIQDEIADCLSLRLDENNKAVRARRLSLELQSKERILVILDDVRANLDLDDIGVPPPCSKQCKVLLTTRSLRVCTLMDCHMEIPLHPLSEEEAWMWFKKHSGLDDCNSSSNLLNVAREVAIECKGIPQTIKEVASSLKRKPIEEWKVSLDTLKYPTALYQVFISFRGRDTRYSFAGFLYHALCREGFKTFMDKEGLQSGDQISQSLIDAIHASRLCIVVFSKNFANSPWCLDELATIFECMKMKNHLVWPIFYKVDPSDVRYQKNSYGKAMDVHKNRFGDDSQKVQQWKSALFEVASLSGEHFKYGYEYEFIQKIVKKVENIKNRLCIQITD